MDTVGEGKGGRTPPKWVEAFLGHLRDGETIAAASRAVGIKPTAPYQTRRCYPAFAAAWDEIRPMGVAVARPIANNRPGLARSERFLVALAETSNVRQAAEIAGLAVATIYKLRRSDLAFAQRWFAALAEGYDNLEMEVLGRLRAGEAGAGAKGSFDTAAALRCLAAHRESVAREKGRRTLEREVTTIASINAKIDRLRLATEAGEAAMATARKEKAARGKTGKPGEARPGAD